VTDLENEKAELLQKKGVGGAVGGVINSGGKALRSSIGGKDSPLKKSS